MRIWLSRSLIAIAALAPGGVLAQSPSDDWQFSATIYGWFPDIGGETSFPAGAGTTTWTSAPSSIT